MPETEEVAVEKTETPHWQHPLLAKKLSDYAYTWRDWLEDWQKARDPKVLINLLHIGFDVDMDRGQEWQDRVIFYLEVAHHWYMGPLHDFKHEDHHAGEMRRKVSRKAWNILCQKAFKNSRVDSEFPEWGRTILDEKVFQKAIWFFSYKDNIPPHFNEDHDSEIARKFLLRLVKMLWENFGWNNPKPPFIEANRKPLLRIAFEMGELIQFSSKDLSDEDIRILEGFALESEYDWKSPLETLEEVAVRGSGFHASAAKTLLMWRILRKERTRQRNILAKSREKTEKAAKDIREVKSRASEIKRTLGVRDIPVDRNKLRKELKSLEEILPQKEETLKAANDEFKPLSEKYREY